MLRRDFLHKSGMGLSIMIAMPKGVAKWINEAPLMLLWNNFLTLAQAQKNNLVPDSLTQAAAKQQAQAGLSWFEAASEWHIFGRHQERYAVQLMSVQHEMMGMIDFVAPIYSLQKNGDWAPLRTLTAFDLEALLQLAQQGLKSDDLLPIASKARFEQPYRYATRTGSIAITTRIKLETAANIDIQFFDNEQTPKQAAQMKSSR